MAGRLAIDRSMGESESASVVVAFNVKRRALSSPLAVFLNEKFGLTFVAYRTCYRCLCVRRCLTAKAVLISSVVVDSLAVSDTVHR